MTLVGHLARRLHCREPSRRAEAQMHFLITALPRRRWRQQAGRPIVLPRSVPVGTRNARPRAPWSAAKLSSRTACRAEDSDVAEGRACSGGSAPAGARPVCAVPGQCALCLRG